MLNKLKTNADLENVEIKTVLADFMTDVIGNVAFGLEMNAIEDPDSKFRQTTKKVFLAQNFFAKVLLLTTFRNIARKLGLKLLTTDITDFFREIVKETVEYRRENKVERNDVLNLLMKIGTEGREGEEELTIDEIAAQCFIFFIAGHETSSSATTYALYKLALHMELQDKLRNEIKSVLAKHENKVTYEAMLEMKYLDMVVNETLCMYPPAPLAARQASKNYKISNSNLEIQKGSLVFVPIFIIHNDSTYYPEPEKFDPERFSAENKAMRHPMAHMPFGDGPRSCIGNRFGLMQTKIALIQLLKNFKVSKTSKTPETIIFNPRAPILQPIEDVVLKLEQL
ncbi:hypothetical protein ACKWTF_013873 [Chironomus riparius]